MKGKGQKRAHNMIVRARKAKSNEIVPSLPEPASYERDAVAFWSRRITLSLAIGNGAGILAISGFISGSENISDAAVFSYDAIAYFLSGLSFSFAAFFISFFWVGFRIDVINDYLEKLEKLKGRQGLHSGFDAIDVWKNRPFIYSLSFILGLAQLGIILAAGAFFYLGSASILTGLSNAACQSTLSQAACGRQPKFPFVSMDSLSLEPTIVSVSGSSRTNDPSGESWISSLVLTPTYNNSEIDSAFFYQYVRLARENPTTYEYETCYIYFSNAMSGDALAYDLSDRLESVVQLSARDAGEVDIRPAEMLVSVFVTDGEGLTGSSKLALSALAGGGVRMGKPTERRNAVQAFVSRRDRPVWVSRRAEMTDECRSLVEAARLLD